MKTFLQYCKACGKKHRMKLLPCPECGVYLTLQPASEAVAEQCKGFDYACDGCEAYREHLRN